MTLAGEPEELAEVLPQSAIVTVVALKAVLDCTYLRDSIADCRKTTSALAQEVTKASHHTVLKTSRPRARDRYCCRFSVLSLEGGKWPGCVVALHKFLVAGIVLIDLFILGVEAACTNAQKMGLLYL